MYRVRALSLPIPAVTASAAIILPIVTGLTLRGSQALAIRAKHTLPGLHIVLLVLLIIYDTALATLALAHMAPPSELDCGLDHRWARLFSNKNAEVVRRIQDRHQCCGLRSPMDRAWPFPDSRHRATSCIETLDRQRRCLEGWRQDEQVVAGLMLFVAIGTFLIKASILSLA